MDWLSEHREWLVDHRQWAYWLGLFSGLTMIFSIVILPVLFTRMAPDYFLENRDEEKSLKRQHPIIRVLAHIFKNILGGLLVCLGIILSLPGVLGQGLLTILIGLMIMDFRGKKRLEIWLVRMRPVNKAINWIRAKKNQPPLILPEKE